MTNSNPNSLKDKISQKKIWLLWAALIVALHVFLIVIYVVRNNENSEMIAINNAQGAVNTKAESLDPISSSQTEASTANDNTDSTSTTLTTQHKNSADERAVDSSQLPINSAMPAMIVHSQDSNTDEQSEPNAKADDESKVTKANHTGVQPTNTDLKDTQASASQSTTSQPSTPQLIVSEQHLEDRKKILQPKYSSDAQQAQSAKDKEQSSKADNTNTNQHTNQPNQQHKADESVVNASSANNESTLHKHHGDKATLQAEMDLTTKQQNAQPISNNHTRPISEQAIRDTHLLSVDLPKSEQQPFVTNNPRINKLQAEVGQLKKKAENTQQELSESIRHVKALNQQKIEKEKQLAQRAYENSLKAKRSKAQQLKKSRANKNTLKKVKSDHPNTKKMASTTSITSNKATSKKHTLNDTKKKTHTQQTTKSTGKNKVKSKTDTSKKSNNKPINSEQTKVNKANKTNKTKNNAKNLEIAQQKKHPDTHTAKDKK